MKCTVNYFLALTFTVLLSCNDNSSETTDASFTGKVFTGKRYIYLMQDSLLIEADHYTVKQPPKINDTITEDGDKTTQSLKKGHSVAFDTVSYYIRTQWGEQLAFQLLNKYKIWLNASSEIRIDMVNGRLDGMESAGEVFIDAIQPLNISSWFDSVAVGVNVYLSAGSGMNIDNKHFLNNMTVTSAYGTAVVTPNMPGKLYPKWEYHPGEEISINKVTKEISTENCSGDHAGSWRDAGVFRFHNAQLKEILWSIEKWYNSSTVMSSYCQKDTSTCSLEFPYRTSLDSALLLINQKIPFEYKRKGKMLFIGQANKPIPATFLKNL